MSPGGVVYGKPLRPPGGAPAAFGLGARGRAGVRFTLQNVSPAPVVVPVVRFAGDHLVTLDFQVSAAVTGIPGLTIGGGAGQSLQIGPGSDSPCGFALVTLQPGESTALFPPDASGCQVTSDAAPIAASGTLEVTFTFRRPVDPAVPLTSDDPALNPLWKRVLAGPYDSEPADFTLVPSSEPELFSPGVVSSAMPYKGHVAPRGPRN